MKNKEGGITLIALAITIIVLLILAVITIALLMSDNGILKQSRTAANQNKIQEYKQELTLKLLEAQLEVMKTKLPTDSGYIGELRTNLRGKIETTNNYKDLVEGTTDDVLFESVTVKKERYKYKITLSEVIYIQRIENDVIGGKEPTTIYANEVEYSSPAGKTENVENIQQALDNLYSLINN